MSTERRYIFNGVTAAPFHGQVIPKGFREITEPEFNQIIAQSQRESDAVVAAWAEQRRVLRQSAKAKLIAGEPLTPEEADVVVG
jgi:hypothetical protein